ncbi:MAG: PQQ-binding-like beta-propeller repeat protein [Culturomica sp.]|jgi:outer membrane protein assembly factor BamB|nr:PQQ-binding-like beta-propeller repeat protein [Culturomica sp.]
MKHLFPLLFFCLLAACSGRPGAAVSGNLDWNLFRGEPSLSGYTATRLPEKPVLLWTYKGESRTVSSPIVKNGTTYWCDKRGGIRGVDLKGEAVFAYDLQTAVEATPMIADSMLYIGRVDGFMTAVSLSTRDTAWNYETMGQISASPNRVEFEGRQALVFGSYDNYLHCIDAQTGEALGRFESGYYLNGAAAIRNSYILFGGCDAWLRIVDSRTGIQTDSLELDAYVPASPAVREDDCYVGDYSGTIYELVLKEGKIARHRKMVSAESENGSFVSMPAVTEKALYFLSGDRYLHSINRKTGETNWKYLLKGNTGESSPLVCRDQIMVCTKTGMVSILDADSGKLLWEYDTGESITASPAVIKDHFMILTAKGTLFCFGEQ